MYIYIYLICTYSTTDRLLSLPTYLIKSGNPIRLEARRLVGFSLIALPITTYCTLCTSYYTWEGEGGGKTAIYLVYCMYHYTIGLKIHSNFGIRNGYFMVQGY